MSPQKACEAVIERIIEINGGPKNINFNVKMVAFNKDGEAGVASITEEEKKAPYATVIDKNGLRVIAGKAIQ
jgi:hypothetical protein